MRHVLAVVFLTLASSAMAARSNASETSWIIDLAKNVLSIGTIVVPAALLVRYLKNNPEKMSGSGLIRYVRMCVVGDVQETKEKTNGVPHTDDLADESPEKPPPTMLQQAITLVVCVGGLQGSYLTWGVLQEQIMTRSYGIDAEGNDVMFQNSQFLVFINRVLALVVAFVIIQATKQPTHTAPGHKYAFPSLSNVMSSWCQYEALKYVNFPTQVLAKASKIIPVMLMGKVVQGKTYPMFEYVLAALMSVGVALFMFSKADVEGKLDSDMGSTSMAGLIILAGYMFFDSFTSNYQSFLFKEHKMSSYQMMLGVNLFSCFFTFWSLLQQGTFFSCVAFVFAYPSFMYHAVVLSIMSATGQVFIFRTLSIYGTLVFTIIMTTRQVISIFLSAIIFNHQFKVQAWLGIMLVFASMFARIYFNARSKK